MALDRDDRPFAFYCGRIISAQSFLQHVSKVRSSILAQAKCLDGTGPKKVLNLCEDRYHFIVLFTAAILEGHVTVMPANQSPGEISRLEALMPGILRVQDRDITQICQMPCVASDNRLSIEALKSDIPPDRIVAEVFTSGTTGLPVTNPKRWGELIHGAERVAARFHLDNSEQYYIVATVPPQHMYGFEMSVVLPLICEVAVHHSRPFYPDDIQTTLKTLPGKRILVTTPVHLKACATLKMEWPKVDFILSATATLSKEVAEAVSQLTGAPVREIYGCSEVGAIATRTLLENSKWELLGDFKLETDDDKVYLSSALYGVPVKLPDHIELEQDGRFRLAGRNADLIKIGGKRGSLSEITLRLKELPGVEDAIVFAPAMNRQQDRLRLAALVVAPGLNVQQLREQIKKHIDAVFVPRPIYLVARLPYNSTGKLPYASLMDMLETMQKKEGRC